MAANDQANMPTGYSLPLQSEQAIYQNMPVTTRMPQPTEAAFKTNESLALEAILNKINQQQLSKQHASAYHNENASSHSGHSSARHSPPTERTDSTSEDSVEVLRLKKQLELTTERMEQMDVKINQFKLAHRTVEQAIGSPFPSVQDLSLRGMNTFDNPQPQPSIEQPIPFSQPGNVGGFPMMGPRFKLPLDNVAAFHPSFTAGPFDPQPAFVDSQARFPGVAPLITPFSAPAPPMRNNMFGAIRQPQPPIGTRLSATAMEFNGWPNQVNQNVADQMACMEPLNYRRLLERSMSCNWKTVVDKIVFNNDQQASIFLQQKLKVGTIEQRFEIVQAIIDKAYPLMVNRFGNFLVQRCFEHSTPDQVVAIAEAIRGRTLPLSMDPFGCHVIQKAFDYVPEEYKAIMVHELLRRIPDTVIHRYACHVWQKLFELRWNNSPPQIMRYVNEALCGMWHEVALGETGSLVVQNIFENCLEDDKRPCIEEILTSLDLIAHGQFGNWCIQHICEHGAIPDRTRAIDMIIMLAPQYSVDQYASKVVEKCLKIGGGEFLDRYLARITETHPERPRMALIDIAGDQFGNYLIHWILNNADPGRREVVAAHIRKHMVSLRGSKYGSKVAMLCATGGTAFNGRQELPTSVRGTQYSGRWTPELERPYSRGPLPSTRREYGYGFR